jgi:glycerol kinase
VVEGIAATVAALVSVIGEDTNTPPEALRVDGGLTHSTALMQAQANISQIPVEVYPSAHATALGAAALSKAAIEPATTLTDALGPWAPETVYVPKWSADQAAAFMTRWMAEADRVAEDHA